MYEYDNSSVNINLNFIFRTGTCIEGFDICQFKSYIHFDIYREYYLLHYVLNGDG